MHCIHRDSYWHMLFVGCLTSQQHSSVSQGQICSDNFTCCDTEIEAADETFYFTQSQYTDTGPTSCITDPITPGAWQSSHWSVNFLVTGMTRPRKIPGQVGFEPWIFRSRDVSDTYRTYARKPCSKSIRLPGFHSLCLLLRSRIKWPVAPHPPTHIPTHPPLSISQEKGSVISGIVLFVFRRFTFQIKYGPRTTSLISR